MARATVTWASSAIAAATVSASGLVTAVTNGSATITATAGDASGSAAVTVAQDVRAVAVVPDSTTVVEGDTLRLAATATDANGQMVAGVDFAWASADTAVAVVDTSGLVTGVGTGEAQVTATAAGLTGRAELVVVTPLPTTVAVTPDSVLTAVGQTAQLTAAVLNQGGRVMDGVPVIWLSAETTVAAVDASGLVTAVGSGAVTITATAGEASGDAHVTVLSNREVLEALYEATDGPNWTRSDNWLTDAPLSEWYGVEADAQGRVVRLFLRGLSGRLPPELGILSSLEELLLWGQLSGPIPRQLGGLSNLERLDFSWNELSGELPPELGGLSSLKRLELQGNDLTGPIPPELGNLASLRLLFLSSNNLSGSVPPELGALTRLLGLMLARNPGLTGALPQSLTGLHSLQRLLAGGTGLCAPSNADFQDWLNRVDSRWIALCAEAETSTAYLVQAVQSRDFPVPLVAGEKALLRVFPTAREATTEGMPWVRARFYLGGRETHVQDIPGKSDPIPTAVDEGSLSGSANTEIAGHVIQPGLEMVIEVDPDGTLNPELRVAKRIPETGRLAVDVRAMPPFDLTLIPFIWTETHDSSIVDLVGAMAADPKHHEMLSSTRALLPIGALAVTAHEPVLSSSNNVGALFGQTNVIRVMEGATGHYMGMMGPPTTGPGGRAQQPGRASSSTPHGHIIAHELGHNLSLSHAPGAPRPDPSYPYPDGSIGAWGYDFRYGGSLVPPSRRDLMSYGTRRWVSDYHFTTALRYRLLEEGAAVAAGSTRSLLLWGGVDADSVPYLEPAFVIDAPASLPDSAGEYRIAGRTASGADLFSFSFTMPEIADGDGSSSFVFALPVRAGWEDGLATITLSGPAGSATLDDDSDIPMAALRGVTVREVTTQLYRRWLREGETGKDKGASSAWLRSWLAAADEAIKGAPVGRSAREDLEADRNRLERM